MMTCQTSRS
ncbi:hypothetical protein E2C01_086605 [Portunus trituberculatus]|uniref:Uncharacterized protein n=1 Tax=Portunus trituberculatus TaxID=210409 RepID=A0A5B7J480_PORTR|nr:hypothetical protein [Portunus trituberculatus]